MSESESFWNVPVVSEMVSLRNFRAFLDILLKRIDTIHPFI
nr:chloroplast envelope membrane protein [Anthurium andraeanum]WDW20954.1 chloroplast envelope membrane protein [Anthurium andraeanum]